LSEFANKRWKLGSIDSLLKRFVRQPGSNRSRSAHSSGGAHAQLGGQAKNALISSWDFAWNWHSPFNCARDNSLWSAAQMLQTPLCSFVVWSQSCRPSCW